MLQKNLTIRVKHVNPKDISPMKIIILQCITKLNDNQNLKNNFLSYPNIPSISFLNKVVHCQQAWTHALRRSKFKGFAMTFHLYANDSKWHPKKRKSGEKGTRNGYLSKKYFIPNQGIYEFQLHLYPNSQHISCILLSPKS
jgi:hypothetical protein